jgi:hypothetical protein
LRFIGCHVPNDQIIHATIIVDETIPHACHLRPLEIGERQARLLRNSLGRLSDDFEAADKGAVERLIVEKRLAGCRRSMCGQELGLP